MPKSVINGYLFYFNFIIVFQFTVAEKKMLYVLPLSVRNLRHFTKKKYKCHEIIEIEHQRRGKEDGANVS